MIWNRARVVNRGGRMKGDASIAVRTASFRSDDSRQAETSALSSDMTEATPEMRLEDGTLFREWLRDDPEQAYAAMVERYYGEIFELTVRIGGSRSEAEDLTQETFIKAYDHLMGFRGQSSPKTWLYRIAINRSIGFTRRMKRWVMKRGEEGADFPDFEVVEAASQDLITEQKDLASKAHRLIQELPPRQRAALVLRVIEEMPFKQVADSMGITEGAAKANVHQALKKLRRMLED
ncbi:sigma-70 family RNA polymerase sigma factor [bacterium]|nr:sigma-70 family RNA polymerase sigma factor [bacterium]